MSLLLSQLGAAPASAPFKPLNWQNPTAFPYATSLRTWTNSLNNTTLAPTGSAPFYQTDWPLSTQTRFIYSQINGRSLNVGTLAVPFRQANWPNPQSQPYATSLRSHSISLNTTTLAATASPFHQDDWPNPKAPARAASLGTFTGPVALNLLGQDTFFATAGRGPNYDWPNPKGPVYPIALRSHTVSPSNTTLSRPFYQTDWPNPNLGAARAASLRTHLDTLKLNLQGLDALPTGKASWPTTFTTANLDRSFATASLLQSVLQPLPIGQSSLDNTAKPARQLNGWTTPNLLETLLSSQTLPFQKSDWQNPTGATRLNSDWISTNLNLTLLAPTVADSPFHQTDWPTPNALAVNWFARMSGGVSNGALTLPGLTPAEIHQRLPLNPFKFRRAMPPATSPWRAARIRLGQTSMEG